MIRVLVPGGFKDTGSCKLLRALMWDAGIRDIPIKDWIEIGHGQQIARDRWRIYNMIDKGDIAVLVGAECLNLWRTDIQITKFHGCLGLWIEKMVYPINHPALAWKGDVTVREKIKDDLQALKQQTEKWSIFVNRNCVKCDMPVSHRDIELVGFCAKHANKNKFNWKKERHKWEVQMSMAQQPSLF